ncbi:hypothetical protein LCGC14_1997700 [marine sediment metagenome]|uniref:Uncharacterized protein n=1 Tax=marine sediment metagenome TaxID=412755 RepID=A0A0F9F4C0_9ZZZZ
MCYLLQKKIAFVIYYHKHNFYSFNALVGALETQKDLNELSIYFLREKSQLIHELDSIITKYEIIIVGISFFTTQLFEICDLISNLRSKFKNRCFFIAGGPHPTGDPLGTLKIGFDVVVVGEGEETIIELIKKIDSNDNFRDTKGIAYLNELHEYSYTGKRKLVDLDQYPPFPIKNRRFGAIEITRGCPYVCYFCQTPYISGTSTRHRSVEVICKYVRELKNYYGDLTDIRFITPNAFSYGSQDGKKPNLEKVEDLLLNTREIIGKQGRIYYGSFPSEVRPEHVYQETLDLVLKYCANDNIVNGAQSGSQIVLDICHRGHNLEDIYNAVELTIKSNLKINVDIIFGLPGENEKDVKLTIKMMKDLANMGARIHAHSFIPLPQTPYAKFSISRVNQLFKKEIKNLISKGLAFGDWKKQERLAIKVSQYLRNNKII